MPAIGANRISNSVYLPRGQLTDKTCERGVLAVLSVAGGNVSEKARGVSSVLSVPRWAASDNRALAADLIEAAMKVCDRHGDGESSRQEMRRQCLELPARMRADLLEHFREGRMGDRGGQGRAGPEGR